jgi:flagellar biosynthesis anti-sigma factor FlgM
MMRIIDSYNRFNNWTVNTTGQGQGPTATQKGSAQESPESAPAAKGDAVAVSAHAVELAQKAANDADTAKVEKLRSAIENGSFAIDRHAIARRIVEGG